MLDSRKNLSQPVLADVQGKLLDAKRGDDWAREQPAATTIVPGAKQMGSPIPAHERWESHLPKRSKGVGALLAGGLIL